MSTASVPAPDVGHLKTIRGRASASSRIEAPAARVYSILADYNQHHPRVLPRQYFKSLEVEAGGVGAGTRIRVAMRVLGTTISFRHIVSEPEPGRVLIESDTNGGTATSFTVDTLDSRGASMLTITTDFTTQRRGLLGRIERHLTIRTLSRILQEGTFTDRQVRPAEPGTPGVMPAVIIRPQWCARGGRFKVPREPTGLA